MATWRERLARWWPGLAGAGCYVALLALEIATETDDFDLVDIAVDAVALALTVGAAAGAALLAMRMQAQHEEKLDLIRALDQARRDGDGWRQRAQAHLDGLRGEMDRQFAAWGMTPAEREVALLVLKGLSHKEIASLRGTSEATVRQQAQAIYRKAKLPGKAAFCAFFLEDLMATASLQERAAAE